jgi:hypothetical protein
LRQAGTLRGAGLPGDALAHVPSYPAEAMTSIGPVSNIEILF